jgi:sugar lactone lactonase YvrE
VALRYRHVRAIPGASNASAGFRGSLRGITTDSSDRLYAAGDSEVRVFDRSGAFLRRWTTAAPAHTVAIAADGRIFVGESRQIEIFDDAGHSLEVWHDPARLGRVSAIGFANGDVLAGDSHGRAIRRFDATGRFLNDIGRDNRTQGFVIPNGVLDFGVDGEGIVHAANPGKHRIERYAPDGTLLGRIGRFGGPDPAGFSGCCNPTNVCIVTRPAGAGRHTLIFTTEKAGPRVKVHDATGALLSLVAADMFDPNCRNMDLAVDSRGRVYVVDTVRREVQVFDPEGQP